MRGLRGGGGEAGDRAEARAGDRRRGMSKQRVLNLFHAEVASPDCRVFPDRVVLTLRGNPKEDTCTQIVHLHIRWEALPWVVRKLRGGPRSAGPARPARARSPCRARGSYVRSRRKEPLKVPPPRHRSEKGG